MIPCLRCAADLIAHHTITATDIPPLKNGSEIVEPACSRCGRRIEAEDVAEYMQSRQHVVLISGTPGAGKSAIGQAIARSYPYLLIDGDAVNHKLRHRVKSNQALQPQEYLCHTEVIRTMLVALGLGYNVVAAYVIEPPDFVRYQSALTPRRVAYDLRVLTPSREVCLTRDAQRPCWTAGLAFVDQWFATFEALRCSRPELCVDTTGETVEESVARHFHGLLCHH